MKRFRNALRKGPTVAVHVVVDRVRDRILERRLNIRSGGLIAIETLMDDYEGNHDYAPTSIDAFKNFMTALEIREGEDVFVDYGCGMGRVLVLATQYPFRRIIGVEISPMLLHVASRNLSRVSASKICDHFELWRGSAELFPLPDDASILYFFNPFHGATLARVLGNVRRSLDRNPRRLNIVFNNPVHLKRSMDAYSWLRPIRRFEYEHECLIYEAGGDA